MHPFHSFACRVPSAECSRRGGLQNQQNASSDMSAYPPSARAAALLSSRGRKLEACGVWTGHNKIVVAAESRVMMAEQAASAPAAAAEAEAPPPAAPAAAAANKMTMVVGVDDSETSYYALQWVLNHFFFTAGGGGQPHQYRLVVVTAKPASTPAVGPAGPGGAPVLFVDPELPNRAATRVIDRAREICHQVAGDDAVFEAVDGDARTVLCEAVERHGAEMLAVGSHGYGAIKRAVLGSVSDYCAHHAHCTVMIVKKPKPNKH